MWNTLTILSRGPFGYISESHVLDFLILTFYVLTDIVYAFSTHSSTPDDSGKLDVNNNVNSKNVHIANRHDDGKRLSTVNIYVNNRKQDLLPKRDTAV